MTEPVKFNQTDFEDNPCDFFTFMKYKGQPFTGILTDDRWICSFKDGNANGCYVEFFENGQVAVDRIYENGNLKSGKEWYPNGVLKLDDNHLYDAEGNLIRIDRCWLYRNGVKRNDFGPDECYIFSSKGEMAMKTMTTMKGKNTVIFYDSVLIECYFELVINLYPEFDLEFYQEGYDHIWGWVAKKYSIDQSEGIRILKTLKNHPTRNVASTAEVLLGYIGKNEFDVDRYVDNLGCHTRIE